MIEKLSEFNNIACVGIVAMLVWFLYSFLYGAIVFFQKDSKIGRFCILWSCIIFTLMFFMIIPYWTIRDKCKDIKKKSEYKKPKEPIVACVDCGGMYKFSFSDEKYYYFNCIKCRHVKLYENIKDQK